MAKVPRRFAALFACCFCLSRFREPPPQQQSISLSNDPLVPSAVAPGGADFTLTVNGSDFVSASVVNLNLRSLPAAYR